MLPNDNRALPFPPSNSLRLRLTLARGSGQQNALRPSLSSCALSLHRSGRVSGDGLLTKLQPFIVRETGPVPVLQSGRGALDCRLHGVIEKRAPWRGAYSGQRPNSYPQTKCRRPVISGDLPAAKIFELIPGSTTHFFEGAFARLTCQVSASPTFKYHFPARIQTKQLSFFYTAQF
jgi:hypothetical protein